ncbi:MAG: tetratricopeptide repeat protein [Blastocatellia bacterium]
MSNAFYQGIGALARKSFVYAIGGLLIGMTGGFKLANDSFRRAQAAEIEARAQRALSQPAGAAAAGADPAMNPQQREKIINETREMIENARKTPTDFAAQMRAADQFMQIRRPEGAMEFLENARKLKPDDPDVLTELAGAFFFLEKFPEAITNARRALKAKSDNPPATFYLAYSLIMSGRDLNDAEQLLNKLEESSRNAPPEAREALAEMRQRLQAARQGKVTSPQPAAGDAKTTLSHGPEEK